MRVTRPVKSSYFLLNRELLCEASLAGGINFLKFEVDLTMSKSDKINEAMASFIVKASPRLESFWHERKQFGSSLGIKKEEDFDKALTTAGIICGGTTRTRRRRDNVAIFKGEQEQEQYNNNNQNQKQNNNQPF